MLNDWHSLGSVQYRKWHVYDMGWNQTKPIILENYCVCGAPFGGPIAMHPDPRKMSVQDVNKPYKLSIYTSSGNLISEMEWTDRSIISMGWTDHEYLALVTDNGILKMYDIYCHNVLDLPLLDYSSHPSTSILECHFWGNGVACMTSDYLLRIAEGISVQDLHINRPRVYTLITRLGVERSYTAMTIIPPLLSRSGFLEVLIGTSDRSVLVIHEHSGGGSSGSGHGGVGGGGGNSASSAHAMAGLSADQSVGQGQGQGHETIIEDQVLHSKLGAPIIKFSLGPDGRFVACYRKDGFLTVMAANFTSKVVDFDTKSASKPIAIEWCGKDSVILQWRNTGLVMVGPYGDWINFPYSDLTAAGGGGQTGPAASGGGGGIHIIPELDCCRIITSYSCEILQLVPSATIAALEIGSMEPAALILDAMDAFEEGDPKADENIRTIAMHNQLGEAVSACIQAASHEFHIGQQQRLLKAASYGKAFCYHHTIGGAEDQQQSMQQSQSFLDNNEYHETAKKLRVLNDIRRPEIGLPLTLQQYNRLTPEVLVGRLTTRHQHFLALKICELLKLKTDRVLIHWACEKLKKLASIGTTSKDEEICKLITERLDNYAYAHNNNSNNRYMNNNNFSQNRISYLGIAKVAHTIGRPRLATMLLDKESGSPDHQIPLVLEMNEEELALQKAINSEDTDLIYFTLISLEARAKPTKQGQETFFGIVQKFPEASNLLRIYFRNKIIINPPLPTSSVTTQPITGLNAINGNTSYLPLHTLLLFHKNYFEAGNQLVSLGLATGRELLPAMPMKYNYFKEAVTLYAQRTVIGSSSSASSASGSTLAGTGSSSTTVIDSSFYKAALEEQVELLEFHHHLHQRCKEPAILGGGGDTKTSYSKYNFDGCSIQETLQRLYEYLVEEPVENKWMEIEITKFIKKFKISEKIIYHLKIHLYSERRDWMMLGKLANEKKSPVGYRPFAVSALKYGASDIDVDRYVEKISVPEDKYELYLEMKAYQKAMDVALRLRDGYRLQEVQRVCNDSNMEKYIKECLAKL